MKRTYSSMQTTTPPQSTSTPSPAIGLEQFEQFASMFNSYSEQFVLMKNSKQGSTPQQSTSTPQSTSDNDWIGIGSQSRTSSEKSDQNTSQSNRKKRKLPTDHRHFKYRPRILTLKKCKERLATRLSDAVKGSELLRKFSSLHAFRGIYNSSYEKLSRRDQYRFGIDGRCRNLLQWV